MMYARIASAAVGLAAVVLLGAGLGRYTVGGFHMREPVDVISSTKPRVPDRHLRAESFTHAPIDHVCKGCDAQLHREDTSYTADSSFDPDDEWAREDDLDRDAARFARSDDRRANVRGPAANSEAEVVVDKDLVMYAATAYPHLDQ